MCGNQEIVLSSEEDIFMLFNNISNTNKMFVDEMPNIGGDVFDNSEIFDDTFQDDLGAFLTGIISDDSCDVLGVNLDLSSSVSSSTTIDDNFDPWLLMNDFDTELENHSVYNSLETSYSPGGEAICLQPELLTMFPHMLEEKNRKRRALLYENPPNVAKGAPVKSQALLSHDYTPKIRAEDDKYFPCSVLNCDKVYSKYSHLRAHLKRHSGEKPFVCNWENCTWRFSRSDELARHKRSHSGVKPYKCELCERAFARSDHLSKHNKVHKKKMAQFGSYHIKKRLRFK